ncbi:unnamed protein product [Microthlaspi erraticum]|uniref:Exocyst complex component EXOC6/Sec15 N-terminal domain-containing protein n=1 Tax=Microthlaspi erraticum TaxID=1685480 RepID=A0A6D2JYX2_9BRAS|nr:unnamed protein product [Microthlaspi erraticum]CAA7047085.1 unnamed protein product [Microthlaspi erraticum]
MESTVEEAARERVNHVIFNNDGDWLVFTANLGGITAEPVAMPNQFQPYGDLYVVKVDGTADVEWDLGPFVRKTFGTGKLETLLQHLKFFARSKESEIEEVCKAHYQEFIHAVDDLKSLLSDVESLKSALSDSNSKLQSVAGPLLSTLDSLVEAQVCRRTSIWRLEP